MKRAAVAVAVAVVAAVLLLTFVGAERVAEPDVLGNCITRNAETKC